MPPTIIPFSGSFQARLALEYSATLLFALSLSLAAGFWLDRQRTETPMVAMRLSQTISEPASRTPGIHEQENTLGPRTLLDRWNPIVRAAAEKHSIPALWLRAVMRNETGGRTVLAGDTPIVSDAGAQGLMQIMPATYREMAALHGLGEDPFNPRDNIFASAAYLRWLKDRYGFPGMFAAYNFGPGNWEAHLRRKRALPGETRNYLKQITAYLKASPANLVHAVHLTRPDGRAVAIETDTIHAITPAPQGGEYAPGTQAIVWMGRKRQAVKEDVALVISRLSIQGVSL